MNNISFNILPSPETNDHEVRIFIDTVDFLGNDYLGIDPSSFFRQDNFDKNGELMIGRCSCGVEGCCDYPVTVTDRKIILSYDKNGEQKLFDILWDGQTETNVKQKAEQFLKEYLQKE